MLCGTGYPCKLEPLPQEKDPGHGQIVILGLQKYIHKKLHRSLQTLEVDYVHMLDSLKSVLLASFANIYIGQWRHQMENFLCAETYS